MMFSEIVLIKILITLMILLYASILDWKYREIDDKSWISLLAAGITLNLVEFFLTRNIKIIIFLLISLVAAYAVAYVLYYTGAMGGGDGKIFLGIAAMFPLYPAPTFTVFPLFFLSVFANSVFICSVIPFFLIMRNLGNIREIKNLKQVVLLFTAYRKRERDIKPFEAVVAKGDEIRLFQNANTMELGRREESDELVWVTPAIPFIIPITLGFVLSLVYGDLTTLLVVEVLG